ncbi:MAG TPA: hypothetical protein VMU25_03530 [Candidatus Paceibacterota bacterium]|nr:hypothetical protein [Candidatus Paceibacterota bacterium]
MPQFPPRDAYTFWDNEHPIVDLHEALSVLGAESSSREPHHLARRSQGDGSPFWEIVVPWYREGDSGGDRSGCDYLQIDQELAHRLVIENLLEQNLVKYFGGSRREVNKFVITEHAAAENRAYEESLLEKAEALLVPGIHTDLTGKARRIDYGREHWRYGRFRVDFRTPLGDRCRVFPETELVVLDSGSAAA